MIANKNYEADIKYTMELNHLILRLLGIWPYGEASSSFLANLKRFLLIVGCYFLLCSELIPTVLYAIIIEKRIRVRLKLISSMMFTILAVLKYSSLVFSMKKVRYCLTCVKNDWRDVANASAREVMMDGTKSARRLLILCSIFMYTSGLYFRTIVPLSKGKIVTDQNVTIRHLPCPSYFIFFNGQISPAYEIIFFLQFLSGFVKYTITVAICSLAALFVTHICAQLEILMALINNLMSESEIDNLDTRLAVIVEYHVKVRK